MVAEGVAPGLEGAELGLLRAEGSGEGLRSMIVQGVFANIECSGVI